jgi:cell wall-associated NlpC family hydrolase
VTSRCRENAGAGLGPVPLSRSRALRRSVVALSTAALTAVVFAFPGATPAVAAPTALTIAEAKAQIEQLEIEAEAIGQEYVGVKDQIDQGRAKLTAKKTDVEEQAARVEQIKRQVGRVALAQFQNRNVDTAAKIFFTSDDSDNFLSQVSTMEKVSENQNNVLQDFQEQQAQLAELEHSTQTDLAVLTEQEKQLAELRADSEKKVAESKKVLAQLTEAERAALAAAEKAARDAAKKLAEDALKDAAAASNTPKASDGAPKNDAPAATGASGRGATALAYARKQLGKPYRFAAAGPDAFDCSGLTSKAWAAAGVTLPRTSQAQIGVGRSVAKSDLQAGDLVFFYSSTAPSHVALYVGNGTILHAPRTGKPVQYTSLDSMPFTGARRPG